MAGRSKPTADGLITLNKHLVTIEFSLYLLLQFSLDFGKGGAEEGCRVHLERKQTHMSGYITALGYSPSIKCMT